MSNTCRICLDEITDTDEIYTTPCKHTFHKECFEHNEQVNRNAILKCPLCNKVLRIPKLSDETINEEIETYKNDWDGNLDCDDLIEQIKLTYKNKFIIDENYIKTKCENNKKTMSGGRRKYTKNRRNKSKRNRKSKRHHFNKYIKTKRYHKKRN